jgi:hypothetical protein
MHGFGERTAFVGSVVEGEDGLLVLRGEQGPDAVARVAEHLRALVVAGVRHVRVDARGASGLESDLLPVLCRAQARLNVRRGLLTVSGLRLGARARAAAV